MNIISEIERHSSEASGENFNFQNKNPVPKEKSKEELKVGPIKLNAKSCGIPIIQDIDYDTSSDDTASV